VLAARGFDGVDAEKHEGAAEKFEPRAAFAEKENAETGRRDGEQVRERGKLGGFEVAKEPVVEKIGQRGAEEASVNDADPGLPRNDAPMPKEAEGGRFVEGDREDEQRSRR